VISSLAPGLGWVAGFALVAWDARAWPLSLPARAGVIASVAAGGTLAAALSMAAPDALRAVTPSAPLAALIGGFLAVALYKRARTVRVETSDAFARGAALAFGLHIFVFAGALSFATAIAFCGLVGFAAWLHTTKRLRGRQLFTVIGLACALRVAASVVDGGSVAPGFLIIALSASLQFARRGWRQR
jgi:hypothetical protein